MLAVMCKGNCRILCKDYNEITMRNMSSVTHLNGLYTRLQWKSFQLSVETSAVRSNTITLLFYLILFQSFQIEKVMIKYSNKQKNPLYSLSLFTLPYQEFWKKVDFNKGDVVLYSGKLHYYACLTTFLFAFLAPCLFQTGTFETLER